MTLKAIVVAAARGLFATVRVRYDGNCSHTRRVLTQWCHVLPRAGIKASLPAACPSALSGGACCWPGSAITFEVPVMVLRMGGVKKYEVGSQIMRMAE